jgi:hypothetical protein
MMTLCPLRRRRCWRAAAIEKAEASNESGSGTSASSTQNMVEAAVKAASGAETLVAQQHWPTEHRHKGPDRDSAPPPPFV